MRGLKMFLFCFVMLIGRFPIPANAGWVRGKLLNLRPIFLLNHLQQLPMAPERGAEAGEARLVELVWYWISPKITNRRPCFAPEQ